MPPNIRTRVRAAAEIVLEKDKSIGPIELLVQMGFLHFSHVRQWKHGNPSYDVLLTSIQCGEKKLAETYSEFLAWAKERQLEPFGAEYRIASRDGNHQLKITSPEDSELDEFFRTNFRPTNLTEKQKA